jgi:hypothetical protein
VFFLLQKLPCLAEDQSKKLGMEISALTERLPEVSNERQGALEVGFRNKTQNFIYVQFSGNYGKGNGIKPPIYTSPENPYWRQPAVFAEFLYEWFDSEGKSILKGKYDVSRESLTLKPNGVKTVLVPVTLPPPGIRKLVVKLSNLQLVPLSSSFNMFQTEDTAIFEELEDQAFITIKK